MKTPLQKKLMEIVWNEKLLFGIMISTIAIFLITQISDSSPSPSTDVKIDTLIPLGYVLTPIKISNIEALKAIVANYGIVDLYSVKDSPQQNQYRFPVAQNIKLIRAPFNKNQYAVLLHETQVEPLLKRGDSFIAVIKNPDTKNKLIVKEKKRNESRIIFGD